MKIIFLDIDGVLAIKHKLRDDYGALFHEEFVDNLKSIIDNTNAKIVISSTWRSSGLEVMQEMWKHRGLPGEVIDVTPYSTRLRFYDDNNVVIEGSESIPRGIEIKYWLKSKKWQRINWSEEKQLEYLEQSKVKNYIILDDDSDMLLDQYEHFIKCSCSKELDAIEGYGLTKAISEKAIKILNSSIIDLYYPK